MTDMAPNDERTVGEVAVPKVEMRQISDRSSLRSDAPQGSARHAAAPLQQIAEVLEAQEEAKVALEEAARDKNVRELSTCVSEFVSTEARYLADLQSVAVAFLEPLRPLLPPQLHYAIFSNLPQLQGLHQGLGTDLERATSETASDSGQACVDAFSKLLPYFRMYATYCCNYPNVAEALCKVAAEHSGAATALVEAEEARGVKLQALLFRPVQRLCVYPLLLERMKKSSQPKSQMRITCESAFAALQELNSEVNERVRQMEARLHMTAVLLLVEGVDHLIEAGRLLHLEALVDMKSPTASTLSAWGRRATYKWYVFSDYLLVCRPKGEGFAKKAPRRNLGDSRRLSDHLTSLLRR